MAKNEIVNQYYNLFDETKGYTEILFRAGKVLQSKELNELQSILKTQITNVGNTILTNGDVIEGCQLVISDDRKQVTMTRGRIYLEGNVRDIPDTVINITGEGTEVIGAILRSQVITPDDDSSLIDVATGYDNYAQDGAYRMKEYVEITINEPNASIMYTLIDGEQISVNKNEDLTQLEKIQNTLARRTFDESGNYKVIGLTISDKVQNNEDKIFINLSSGKAYIKGYEVQRDTDYTILLDRPTTLRIAENEPKTFRDGTTRYTLNNNYINSIKKLMSIVEKSDNITRGSIIGGIDYLPLAPAVEVISVTQGSEVFVNGTDFQLANDGIDWSIGSHAPDPGSTYQCTWTYNKTMIKDTDYKLTLSEDKTLGYIDFLNGDKPTNGSTFLVNYDYMLARIDVISLDMYGNVVVTKGQPDILRTVSTPNVDSSEVLPIGSVMLIPMTDTPTILNNNTKALTMLDLYNILERVNDIEYNQAITDLDQEAAAGENATELMGVFTDGFIGLTKSDPYHTEWSATIDLQNAELTVPFVAEVFPLEPDTESDYSANTFDRILTNGCTEIKLLSQTLATNAFRVNSYNAFPKSPTVVISPSVDNWIDESTITVHGGVTTRVVTFLTWSQYYASSWYKNQSTTQSAVQSIINSAITYMRQRSISIKISNLEPEVDNVVVLFNKQQIQVSPTSSSYQGTKSGTLKADINGNTAGKFVVPANTLCGTVEVKAYAENTPSLSGTATYTANGTKRVITRKVWTEKVSPRITDPIAQSFQFDMDQYVTGVGLFFRDKNLSEPITVQVRNMVNGYPGTTVYAEKVVQPSAVKTSNNGTNETKVVFDNPVYCNANEAYCFTILSDSDIDSIWIAETAKTDITSRSIVSKNPFLNGTMFSSSNAITWTAHQASDVKFNLYGLKFNSTGKVKFKAIEDTSLDRIELMSDESIPAGCSIQWQYSVNGEDFLPIEAYNSRDLSELAESIQVQAILTGTTTTSPAIALDSLILVGSHNEQEGVYVSKNVPVAAGFNTVKIVADIYLPTGTNAVLYFATDISGTNWQTVTNTNTVQKSSNYKTYTFEQTLGDIAYNYRVKVVLSTVDKVNRPRVQNLRSIMKTV
jgi:hypothetical protein